MSEERRGSPRYRVDVPARLMVAAETLDVQLRDVCRDAALLDVPRALALESEVYLKVELHWTGGMLELPGRVIRVAPGESGSYATAMLFRGVTPTVATQIALLLDEYQQGKR
jgi:phage baseplate assembly protein gpV